VYGVSSYSSGSSGGGSSGSYSGGPVYSSQYRALPSYAATSSSLRPSESTGSSTIPSDEIQIMLSVPADAKVLVNGKPTSSTGSLRRFVSKDLNPNDTYRFDIQATYAVDGKEVTQSRAIVARAGGLEEIAFEGSQSDDPVETILTLNVPQGATVVLANNPTTSQGGSRVYRTKQLKSGQVWEDYKIEVTYGGQTKEKTIRLIGGDKLEMSFQFDEYEAKKLASN